MSKSRINFTAAAVTEIDVGAKKCFDLYRYCESRRRVLLQHVHEGYEKDLWEYIED